MKGGMKGMMLIALGACVAARVSGAVLETVRWQSEIDAAAKRGGGRVVVPQGVHPVGQLELKSNVELCLEKGAVLEGSADIKDYPAVALPFSEGAWCAVIRGVGVTNVAITGEGEINGRGERFSMNFRHVPKDVCTEVFGVRPVERPPKLSFEVVREDPDALGGTAILKVIRICYGGALGERDFTAIAYFPKTGRPAPTFVYVGLSTDGLNSHRQPGDGQEWPKQLDERWPVQKILARGYATVAYRVTDLAPDDDYGFRVGAYTCFETRESRRPESWGALSAWAWGASRVADWLETESLADANRLAVVGLSRCGKTAIWAAATDRRFGLCCASGAGCCGDKLNHVELAPVNDEHVGRILRFRQWFSRRFDKYTGHDLDMPFDQHQLLALIAPRFLYLAAASDDDGAGPYGQYLSAVFASPAWELYGKKGLVAPEGFPAVGADLQAGSIAFHLRKGSHDLLAYDWFRFLDYARKQGWER